MRFRKKFETNCGYCGKVIYRSNHQINGNKSGCYCDTVCFNKKTKYKRSYPFFIGKCAACESDVFVGNVAEYWQKTTSKLRFCNRHCIMVYRNKYCWTTEEKRLLAIKRGKALKGKKKSERARLNMSLANLGEKSHFWKGGKTEISRRIRNSAKMTEWKRKILEKDNFTCTFCLKRGGRLEADHIVPFSVLMDVVMKADGDKYIMAMNDDRLWDLSNGRTLCKPCHLQTETFAIKHLLKDL